MRHIARHRFVRPLSLVLSLSLALTTGPLIAASPAAAAGEQDPVFSYLVETGLGACNNSRITVSVQPPGDPTLPYYGNTNSSGWALIDSTGRRIKERVFLSLRGIPKTYNAILSFGKDKFIRGDTGAVTEIRYVFDVPQLPPGPYSGEIIVQRDYLGGDTHPVMETISLEHTGYMEAPAIQGLDQDALGEWLDLKLRLAPTGNPDAVGYGQIHWAQGIAYLDIGCHWIQQVAILDVTATSSSGQVGWTDHVPSYTTGITTDTGGGLVHSFSVPYNPLWTYKVHARVYRYYRGVAELDFEAEKDFPTDEARWEEDTNQGSSGAGPLVGEPVNAATGNFILPATDIKPAGAGGLTFSRFYNSTEEEIGALGPGWTHNFARHLEFHDGGRVGLVDSDGRHDFFLEAPEGGYVPEDPSVHSSLERLSDQSFRLAQKDKTVLSFCRYGNLTAMTDRNGNATIVSYGCGKPTLVTDPYGRTLSFAYDEQGRLRQVADWTGRTWSYRFDAFGNLSEMEDPTGGLTRYSYDAAQRLAAIVEPEGNIAIQNTYDDQGRVSQQTNAVGETMTFSYDETARRTTVTDAAGETIVHTFDEAGRALSRTDQERRTTCPASTLLDTFCRK